MVPCLSLCRFMLINFALDSVFHVIVNRKDTIDSMGSVDRSGSVSERALSPVGVAVISVVNPLDVAKVFAHLHELDLRFHLRCDPVKKLLAYPETKSKKLEVESKGQKTAPSNSVSCRSSITNSKGTSDAVYPHCLQVLATATACCHVMKLKISSQEKQTGVIDIESFVQIAIANDFVKVPSVFEIACADVVSINGGSQLVVDAMSELHSQVQLMSSDAKLSLEEMLKQNLKSLGVDLDSLMDPSD
ncbi:hypothetical protein Droror1_Dr00017899 [Drosera rotundifolia]